MYQPKRAACLSVVALVLAVGLVNGTEPSTGREQVSRVDYAPAAEQPASQPDGLGGLVSSLTANQDIWEKRDTTTTTGAPTCVCQETNAQQGQAKQPADEENVSKWKKGAKKMAKKYKVITISLPEDSETEADAFIETKIDEQPELEQLAKPEAAPKVLAKKEQQVELAAEGQAAEQEQEEEEAQEESAAAAGKPEEKAQKPASREAEPRSKETKASKKLDGKKSSESNGKRSKREADNKKRSKRDEKHSKRSSSSSSKEHKKSNKKADHKGKKAKK